MNAIEQAIAWIELDKRCCGPDGFCLKCDIDLKNRFERSPEPTRRFLVDTLCSCSVQDFQTHRALLWLVAFLDELEFDRFVGRIAHFAPFETSVARTIIRLSEGNGINIFFDSFNNHASPVRRRFHLHPALAPALLAATIRSGSEAEDAIALLNYFHPIAHSHPALQSALPIWQAERIHRGEDDRARWLKEHEQSQIEADRLSEELAASEDHFQKIESGGTESILRSILAANALTISDCPERWTYLTEKELASIPPGLLEKVAHRLSSQKLEQSWERFKNRIVHLLKSRAHSQERCACLARLQGLSLIEKLQFACDSKWSLTYYPEDWAEETVRLVTDIPTMLRMEIVSKLMRLRRRCAWRDTRKALLNRL